MDVPVNVDICCRSTVIYQIEDWLNERAGRSKCSICCQGSIAIDVPINEHICCSSTVKYQIATGAPINVDICCSSTVVCRKLRINWTCCLELVHYSLSRFHCKKCSHECRYICVVALPYTNLRIVEWICCSELVHYSLSRFHCNRCSCKCSHMVQ